MEKTIFNLTPVFNNHIDMVSDDVSCSTNNSDELYSNMAVCNDEINDGGRLTLADLDCSHKNEDIDDDMLSEISTVCYDETDHMEWDGSVTLPVGSPNIFKNYKNTTTDQTENDDDDDMESVSLSEVTPYNSIDLKEAERLGMTVPEMFEMYREINEYAEQQERMERERYSYEEWPLHIGVDGYEDEGFNEYYYG